MYTDIHCHTAGAGYGGSGCFVSPGLRNNWRYDAFLKAFGVTDDDLSFYGDEVVIQRLSVNIAESKFVSKAVVLAMDGVYGADGRLDKSKTEVYIPNDYLGRTLAYYPNLFFGASVNPSRPDALDELDRVKAAGAVLVKWLPSVMGFDPADRRNAAFYRKLASLGLPLLTHTGSEFSFTHSDDGLALPSKLRLALEQGVTVIAAHAGASGSEDGVPNMDVLIGMFGEYDNLYADISSLTQINKAGSLPRLLAHTGYHGRLLYGSDMPLINTGLVSPMWYPRRLGIMKTLGITFEENAWDRDVRLKKELGVPEIVFTNPGKMLRI